MDYTRSFVRQDLPAARYARLPGQLCRGAVATVVIATLSISSFEHRATATLRPTTNASSAVISPGGEWTTYGENNERRANQQKSPTLRSLRQRWTSTSLNGPIYGEPLIFDGHIYVATEENYVYALSADTGRILWHRHLGAAVPSSALPCGDIDPTVGVTSTMVIDPDTGHLFASVMTFSAGVVYHSLFALDAATGRELFNRDIDQPGWTAADQLQRTGLALGSGIVYVGFGGNYGDCGRYLGYVVGVRESNIGSLLSYHVPATNEGAIWAPSGLSINAAGDVFAATGNSSSHGAFDGGDAVIKLSPLLREIDYFAPTNYVADNTSDADLGSTAPILLPGNRAFIVGKETVGYLLDANHLGGIGGQISSTSICNARGGDAYAAPFIYVACPDSTLMAVRFRAGRVATAWQGPPGTDASPTVAGGLVWSAASGELIGLNQTTGAEIVHIPTLMTEHFAAPSAGEGLLVIGGSDQVEAFEGPRGYLR